MDNETLQNLYNNLQKYINKWFYQTLKIWGLGLIIIIIMYILLRKTRFSKIIKGILTSYLAVTSVFLFNYFVYGNSLPTKWQLEGNLLTLGLFMLSYIIVHSKEIYESIRRKG